MPCTTLSLDDTLPPWKDVAPFSVPVPRYTSYPTAPMWGDMTPGEAEAAIRGSDPNHPLSVYVHVPFCARLCLYCGCTTTVTKSAPRMTSYVDLVLHELEMTRKLTGPRTLSQLHLGGGTPTHLPVDPLHKLVSAVLEAYVPAEGAELSVELDPATVTREHLSTLRALGFNRASLGVQDFDEDVQRMVGRHQTPEQTEAAFTMCRELGFESINVDLMYGLPGQTPETVVATAKRAAQLHPDRFAVFGYAHVPKLRPQQRKMERHGLPDPAARWDMLRGMHSVLQGEGYHAVGMDHFAKDSDELIRARRDRRLWRNFQGYTVRSSADLLALGASAISDIGGAYIQNARTVSEYRAAIEGGRLPTVKGHQRTRADNVRRFAINQLMCHLRVGPRVIDEEFGPGAWETIGDEFEKLRDLTSRDLVEIDGDDVEVTRLGRPLVRLAAAAFDAHLARSPLQMADDAEGPTFSQAV